MTNVQQQRLNESRQRRRTDNWLQVNDRGMVSAKDWPCICGKKWRICTERGSRRWRGNPIDVTPFDQWCSERLPRGKDGTVKMDVDAAFRRFVPGVDHLGHIIQCEVKTWGAEPGLATVLTLGAMNTGRIHGAMMLTLYDGNTPSLPNHFPVSYSDVHKPEQPVAANSMDLIFPTADGTVYEYGPPVTEGTLIEMLTTGFGDMTSLLDLFTVMNKKFLGDVVDAV